MAKISSSRIVATLAAATLSLSLVACNPGESVGRDTAAVGGQFEFISPGGQQIIDYAPEGCKPVGKVFGPSLENDNKEISFEDFKDQIVILNAWGQWCASCRSEPDDLQYVQEQMEKQGIGAILGINVRDNVRQAPIDFVKDNGITYPSIYDPTFVNVGALGGISASVIPTTIILDKQHRPAKVFLCEVDYTMLIKAVSEVRTEG